MFGFHHTIRISVRLSTRQVHRLDELRERHGLTREQYLVEEILWLLGPEPTPTHITFHEDTMNPTEAGQTQVFTGTLAPVGSAFPTDATFTVTSNDSAVTPTVDSTGLVVSVTYPEGWTESTTTPLAFSYAAASASNPSFALTATITPSAPPANFPTSITFAQSE